jgi:anthranilate phosphoribosyltransferase
VSPTGQAVLDLRGLIEQVLEGRDLDESTAERLLCALAAGGLPAAQQAGLLVALRAKGESVAELVGFARGMLALARGPLPRRGSLLVDTCGTGGDGSGSFNLSSAAALLVAALGIPVAKHGNRAVSSRCGSADLMQALGIPFPDDARAAGALLARRGFVFLFAPHFHPAAAALAMLRRELGLRTAFNLLGPLVNPARPSHQLCGAFSPEAARKLAPASSALGVGRAFVVHGAGGLDEATPVGPFLLLEATGAGVREHVLDPRAFGLPPCRPEDLAGGDAAQNAGRLEALLRGERGPLRDALVLNAALVLLLVGRERDARAAARIAGQALDDGRTRALLCALRADGGAP